MADTANVYRNNILTGKLTRDNSGFTFRYDDLYFSNPDLHAISLTLPKNKQEHRSRYLFPFFFNMLSEGLNKKLQCRYLKIDGKDYFALLLATAQNDTIGAITVRPTEENK